MLFSIDGLTPKVHETVFVAPTASVIGDVEIGANASIWFGCVLRGDQGKIRVGEGTNIQDGSVVHEETTIGKNCVVGHLTLVHRCVVGDNVLIGNGALVFGPCEIADGAVIAAGAVVIPGTSVAADTMMTGLPAKPTGETQERHRKETLALLQRYQRHRGNYLERLRPVDGTSG